MYVNSHTRNQVYHNDASPVDEHAWIQDQLVGHFQDTADVIARLNPDYPVYCLCLAELEKQVCEFIHGFPGTVGFAVKANSEPLVLNALYESGIKVFDVASLDEIQRIHEISQDARQLYDNPIKSRYEIEKAYFDYGVRSFVLDDQIELDKLIAVIGNDKDVQLTVRYKLPISHAVQDLSTKFGASEEEAVTLLKSVKEAGFRPALTFHPGSQCIDPVAYKMHIEAAARICDKAGVNITMLNVGGGFPATYLDSSGPPLTEYFAVIEKTFNKYFADTDCELVCEPGRALVNSSSSLLCKIKHRRKDNILFINDGVYGGFMEQWVSVFDLPLKVYRDARQLIEAIEEFEIYGPTCDALDHFRRKTPLPESITEGDWIEFGLMGSYGSSTTTRFNGYASERYAIVEKGF